MTGPERNTGIPSSEAEAIKQRLAERMLNDMIANGGPTPTARPSMQQPRGPENMRQARPSQPGVGPRRQPRTPAGPGQQPYGSAQPRQRPTSGRPSSQGARPGFSQGQMPPRRAPGQRGPQAPGEQQADPRRDQQRPSRPSTGAAARSQRPAAASRPTEEKANSNNETAKPGNEVEVVNKNKSLAVTTSETANRAPFLDRFSKKTKVVAAAVGTVALVSGVAWGAKEDSLPFTGGNQPAVNNIEVEEMGGGDITAVGPEALNQDNCNSEGAAVATLTVSGSLPLVYELTPSTEDAEPAPVDPYMSDLHGDLAQFVTESGYPELTLNDQVIEIYACEKIDTPAQVVVQTNDGLAVDLGDVDFIARLPEGGSIVPQTEAYMTELGDGVTATWPTSPFLAQNPDIYTNDSLQEVNDVHSTAGQMRGGVNDAVRAILGQAADANPNSQFNEAMALPEDATLIDVLKRALAARLARDVSVDDISFNNTFGGFTPQLTRQNLSGAYLNPNVDERFIISDVSAIIGSIDQPVPEPEAEETEDNVEEQ